MLWHELTLLATLCLGSGVDEARAVFNEVEAAVTSRAFSIETLPDCADEFAELEVARDATGRVRRLLHSFGSEDSSQRATSYYDAGGRLRFLFVKVGAVPSAWVEARWWFDRRGKRIKRARRSGGEGPTYYAHQPEPYLVSDPAAFIAARTTCR